MSVPGTDCSNFLQRMAALHRDVDDACLVEAEDDASLQLRDRVVEVHHRPSGADQRLERPLDQFLPALHQDLYFDVVGNHLLVDDEALEVVIGL